MKFSKTFSANYPGVVYADERSFPNGWVGPNQLGELFVPTSAIYDTGSGKTRVTFDVLRRASTVGGAA